MSGWNVLSDSVFDWYRSPSNNQFDYEAKQFVRNIPLIGGMFQQDDTGRRMQDYLDNRGLSWSDIRYNQAPFGQTYGGALANAGVSAMNLYRSATRKQSDRSKQSARRGGRGRPPTGRIPIGLAKEYVTPTGKYTRKYYADFRGGKIKGGQYHVNQNGRKSYPSTYRRYRGY